MLNIEEVAQALRQPAGPSTLFASEASITLNREAFVRACHVTWKEIHVKTVNQLLFWEGFLKREKTNPIGPAIADMAEYQRHVSRKINDSIVWTLAGMRRHVVKRLCLYHPRPWLTEANSEVVMKVIRDINADPLSIAIWNDATSCVDVGDISYIESGLSPELKFLELKEGRVNEKVMKLIETQEEEGFQEQFKLFEAEHGKAGISQYKRATRQKQVSESALELLQNDEGIDPVTNLQMRVIDLKGTGGDSYDKQLNEVLKKALDAPESECIELISDCIWVYATANRKAGFHAARLIAQERIAERVSLFANTLRRKLPAWDRDRIFCLTDGFRIPMAKPLFLRSLDIPIVASVVEGDLMLKVFFYLDWERFRPVAQAAGGEFTWSSEKDARRSRSLDPHIRPPVFGGRLAQIQNGSTKYQITDPNLVQMFFDGTTPKAVAQSVMKTATILEENPSLLEGLGQPLRRP